MAVSSLVPTATTPQDNWQLIASSTPTTGSVVSFTSIPSTWRKLWVVTNSRISTSASGYFFVTVNSIGGTGIEYNYFRYSSTGHTFSDESGLFQQSAGTLFNFDVVFNNPSTTQPFVKFDGVLSNSGSSAHRVVGWCPTATSNITRIDLTLDTADLTTNTGTLYLYGTY